MRDNERQNDDVLDHLMIEEFLRVSQQIITNSKPLPADFAKVLDDNYWDLLITDKKE